MFDNFVSVIQSYLGIILAVIVFLVFLIFRKKLAKIILSIIGKMIFIKNPQRRKGFTDSLMKPISSYFIVLGAYFGVLIFQYKHNFISSAMPYINGAFKIISILIACWCIINFISENLVDILSEKNPNQQINNIAVKFIANVLRILTVCIAVVMVLSEFGYNISGLITGLGVGGLAVSLAAQDSLKSLISGFVIMFDKPFDVGDFIETADFSGTVEDITIRSTRIRKLDDTVIVVPNTKLSDDLITNYAKLTKRLVEFKIGLLYSTTCETLKKCEGEIRSYLEANEKVDNQSIRVRFVEYDDSSVNLQIRCYVFVTKIEDYYEMLEEINFAIKEIIDANDTDFAFPTQTLYIEK